jgi:hypothetical protein
VGLPARAAVFFRVQVFSMPHFGLMDEKKLGPVEGPLQRARLHIRGGRRRLRQGKISAGIVTLYDALEGAMQSYIGEPSRLARLGMRNGEDVSSDTVLYAALVRSGVIDGTFDFESFDRLTERALSEELPGYDYRELLAGIEAVMTQLGVMPFDETLLPPEDPKTF